MRVSRDVRLHSRQGQRRRAEERSASGVDAGLRELYISVNPAKFHVQHVVEKLGVSDRAQAAYCAAELGLIY